MTTLLTATAAAPQLSPPWYTLWNEINSSVGATPRVTVSELDTTKTPYVTTITAGDDTQAKMLASVLTQLHLLGNIGVQVVVKNAQGQVVPPATPANADELVQMLTTALKGNPLFVQAMAQELFPRGPLNVFAVFTKSVIQFYNDNLADLYRNFNGVTASVFADVLMPAPGGISVLCSTTKS